MTHLIVPIALAAWGCGNPKVVSNVVKSDSNLPAGWTRASAKGENVSIGLAPGWVAKDLSANEAGSAFKAGGSANPKMGDASSQGMSAAMNGNFKIMAYHQPDGKVPFAPNVNVLELPRPENAADDQIVAANDEQWKAMGGKVLSKQKVQLGDNPATLWIVELPFNSQAGPQTLSYRSYLILKGGKQYYITFSMLKGSPLDKDAEAMAKTFRPDRIGLPRRVQ